MKGCCITHFNREKVKDPWHRYRTLRNKCKYHGYEFGIEKELYYSLIKSPCYYCQGKLNESGTGLDRIDSSKGYITTNVRPCCKLCNGMKSDLTEGEFFKRIQMIYSVHGSHQRTED